MLSDYKGIKLQKSVNKKITGKYQNTWRLSKTLLKAQAQRGHPKRNLKLFELNENENTTY